jgi:hypothetical protein
MRPGSLPIEIGEPGTNVVGLMGIIELPVFPKLLGMLV